MFSSKSITIIRLTLEEVYSQVNCPQQGSLYVLGPKHKITPRKPTKDAYNIDDSKT